MSKLIWIIVVIVLIVGGFFLFSGGDDDAEVGSGGDIDQPLDGGDTGESIDDIPESEFSNLDTSDDVFDEIDNVIDEIG